ncbi:hypothetical protein HU200_033240 [Digitaria exilis]|uniref:YDG domain-containing protein n=1 Tax=Digitaria exilis TaxID=1010633 RepID=A0A835ENL8_9POAL|nr:hypothetical protein HU200_033240 [Digitaria exilis]CAB3502488.1 unnamed protein product [Digitaria exilis]
MVSRTPGTEPPRKRVATEAAAFSAARGWPKRFGDRYYSPPPRPRSRPPSPRHRAAEGRRGRGDAEEATCDGTLGALRRGGGGDGAGKAEEGGDGSPGGRGRGGGGGAAKSGVEARAGAGAAGGNAASDGDSAAGAAVAAPRERGGSVGGEVGSKRPFATIGSRSRVYPPPERKEVSATRSFPLGRGRSTTAPLAGADDGLGLVPAPARPDGASAELRKSATRPLSIEKAGNLRVPKKVSAPAAGALKITEAGSGGVLKEASVHAGSGGAPKKASAHAVSGGLRKKVSAHAAVARRSSDPSRWSAVAAADGFLDTGSKGVAEGGRFGRSKELVPARPLLPKPRNIPTIRRFQLEHRRVRMSQSLKSANKRTLTESKGSATARGFSVPKKKMIVNHPDYLRMKVASACTMGTINKPDDVLESILEDDDFWKELAAYEESDHVSSDVPSVRCQRQCGTQNTDARSKVEMMCKRFQFVLFAIVKVVKRCSLKTSRIDLAAHHVIKNLPGYTKPEPIVGNVPGVEVGDQFLYKVELALVGLHRQLRKGIDTIRGGNGELFAISIVASGGYPDTLSSSGELVYIGSGGKLAGKKSDENQKLKGGNLALKNCMQTQSPVRVIFGFKTREARSKGASAFIYDGLYRVVKCWIDGEQGSKMFKYKLQRIPGQPELPHSKTGIMRWGQ